MLRYFVCIVAIMLLVPERGESARILAIFHFPGRSHAVSFGPFLDELANRGHQMTVVTAYPRKSPLKNYKEIIIEDYLNKGGPKVNFFESHSTNIFTFIFAFRSLTVPMCETFLKEPGIQDLIHSPDQQFDLLIYEPFFNECAYGLVYKFKVPTMHIAANTMMKWMGDGIGNPFMYSYLPDTMLSYTDHMSFKERLINAATVTLFDLERHWVTIPKMEELMRKYFNDPSIPSVQELENNASFLLMNSHVTHYYPRPLTPNTIEVGGMHLKEPQKLPTDLQKLLDGATDGAVYFSLGSNVRSVDMPERVRQHFLKAFSKLKQKVLWKWESDTLPGQPKNVHLSKWFPQSDILAHPNIRLFITHGGLMSTQEATFFGVPLIAIPIMTDQKLNALRAQNSGYAVIMDVPNITEESMNWALHEVLHETRYRENAKRVSSIFRDAPDKPLDRAVFWTEYVIRHKGAPHLRSAALELNVFQYYLLDVIAVLLVAALVSVVLLVVFVRMIVRSLCSKSSKNSVKKCQAVSKSKKKN